MDAKRLQLLGAFAAGCLATLAFVGSRWEGESRPTEVAHVRTVMPSQASAAEPEERDATDEHAELDPSRGTGADTQRGTGADTQEDAKPESGSSVAEVLGRLEAAYREDVAREQALHEAAATPVNAERSGNEAAVAPPVAAAVPAVPVAGTAAVTAAPVVATAAVTPAAPPAAAAAPVEVTAPPVMVAQNEAPPRVSTGDIHVGDTHRNVNVGSVHQGDAYALQQLALIQYIQFITLSQHGAVAAPAPQRASKPGVRRMPPFTTSLTNPDNPWGFDFPPTPLVK